MEQYVNKAAVMAEMEKRVKEAEIILRDVPSSAIFGLTQAYKNVLSFLDTLETKELPSIPSNIDEAAKDYARCYTESDNGNGGDDWEDDISIAFTAGAQWQIAQMMKDEERHELTWEDIEAIDQIFTDVFKEGFDVITDNYYQEVLKRFKGLKHVK